MHFKISCISVYSKSKIRVYLPYSISISMQPDPKFAYIAFDVFPSQKGAATHIQHCLVALQNTFNCGVLICLGNNHMPAVQFDKERNLYVYRFQQKIVNFLKRTQKFQEFVSEVLSLTANKSIHIVQFRDIWSAIPALSAKQSFSTVFEVNSFASIELPNRYPAISQRVIEKIKSLEEYSIQHSKALITPSAVTQSYIQHHFNVPKNKIQVIPNGVQLYSATRSTKDLGDYILYFGALQKWQGIKILLKAMKELSDVSVKLVICASVPKKRTLHYHQLAQDYGVSHQLIWLYELDKQQLAEKIKNALFTVAPLTACDRNLTQGCHPLKIIESMGYGVPVLASRLPVVSEIITENKEGFLITADRPELLGRKMRGLLADPKKLQDMGTKAKNKIKENYLWQHQEEKMQLLYNNLIYGY